MSNVKLTLRGLVPYATVGIWRSADVKSGNHIFLGRPPSYSHVENIQGYVGDVLIRVRQKLYLPFETTAALQEPQTDTTVSMVHDPIQIQREETALPEFVDALRVWLIEQEYDIQPLNSTADKMEYTYHIIHVLNNTSVVQLECFLYNVKCPSIDETKSDHLLVEWCDPNMFTLVRQSIDSMFARLGQKPLWVI